MGIFVIQQGHGLYTVGDRTFQAGAGDVVVVPPDLVHTFRATDDSTLTHLAIHQACHGIGARVQ
ncbi:MAG: cupin domain-containing protein [Dehalococcoidia bacterium]|nr:cupin domain-containing protein [Dehalococcoidia bacterium]